MKQYRVSITTQAQQQMTDIAHYIAVDLQNPDAALHMLDLFDQMMHSLSSFPQRIPLTEEPPWHSQGIRRAVIQSYLMYFWVDEASADVQIIAVIYGKRDQHEALSVAIP